MWAWAACYGLLRDWKTTRNIKQPSLGEQTCGEGGCQISGKEMAHWLKLTYYWCPAQWGVWEQWEWTKLWSLDERKQNNKLKDIQTICKAQEGWKWKLTVFSHPFDVTQSCVHRTHLHHTQLSHDPASLLRFTRFWIHTSFIHCHLHLCKKLFKNVTFPPPKVHKVDCLPDPLVCYDVPRVNSFSRLYYL